MKKLFSICLIFISSFLFSQTKDSHETKISAENFKKAVFVRDVVSELQSNYDVIQAEYTFKKKGLICQEVAIGNEIPKSLINYSFKKGDYIFIDLKAKILDNSKNPKFLEITKKITIQ